MTLATTDHCTVRVFLHSHPYALIAQNLNLVTTLRRWKEDAPWN